MAERNRIALRFVIDKSWWGGVYYILNIIKSFNALEDEKKPTVILLCCSEEDYKFAKEYSKYPYIEYRTVYNPHSVPLLNRIVNKIGRMTIGRNLVPGNRFNEIVDAIYPLLEYDEMQSPSPRFAWIPDLQHKHFPDFFTSKELKQRDYNIQGMIDSNMPIVFSSEDSREDFHSFYQYDRNRTKVFRFTSGIPEKRINEDEILSKYGVKKGTYFFCANQFWTHKNHLLLLKAVKILKDKGVNVDLLCSGNIADYRNPTYFSSIEKYIRDNFLEENIRILGHIPKDDIIALLDNCQAMIQPSLFEGWNTSIEEAKALNKYMILSDLSLHKEQASCNALLFKKDSVESLADSILEIVQKRPAIKIYDYRENIKKSAYSILYILLGH